MSDDYKGIGPLASTPLVTGFDRAKPGSDQTVEAVYMLRSDHDAPAAEVTRLTGELATVTAALKTVLDREAETSRRNDDRAEAAETALATMTAERDEARLAARQFFEQNNALQDLLATSPVGMAFDNLATARAEGVAEGLRRAQLAAQQALIDAAHEYGSRPVLKFSSAMFQAETIASNAILALIPGPPAPAKPADGPRHASGPIDPENGFATTGAEARWIADTEAGVYDDDTGDIGRSIANTFAPPASDEGGEG